MSKQVGQWPNNTNNTYIIDHNPPMSAITPLRTPGISGLKSRVLKLTFFSLKIMVKSGLEFILKLTELLQRYLLTCQANSAQPGRFFLHWAAATLKGLGQFQNKF